MIDFGLSEEYLKGFNDRIKGEPFDESESEEWKNGWNNANLRLKQKD